MFPPKTRNKKRMSVLTTAIQYCTGSCSQNNEARKEMKGIQIGRGKTISFFRRHNPIYIYIVNPKESKKKTS